MQWSVNFSDGLAILSTGTLSVTRRIFPGVSYMPTPTLSLHVMTSLISLSAVYEAFINITLFSLLWTFRKRVRPGILFFIYIFGYSLTQIIVFFWRENEIVFRGLKQAQLTAIVVIILTGILFLWYYRRQHRIRTTGQNPR